MAVNANTFDPNNPNANTSNATQQPGTGAPSTTGGTPSQPIGISGTEASSTPDASGNASSPKPTSSGRFQNLNAYLRANQGYDLAGNVNNNLTSRANDLQKNFAQAQNDYQTSLNNARQRYDSQFVNNTLQDPTKASQDDTNRFAQMRDAQYKGPTQLDPSLQTQAQDYTNLAGNVGTEQGRYNLLSQLYNTPTYTSGQKTLDNLFLQGNPQQLANLQSNQVTANQLNNSLGQAQANASSQAIDATNEANATQQATRNALGQAITGFDTQMGQNVGTALSNRDAAFQKELFGLQNPNQGISSDDASKFGLLQTLGNAKSMPIYTLDPGKYLQESTLAPTNQSVASADDYARIGALNNLSGGKLTDPDVSKILDSYNNPNLAGSFAKANPYDFNTAGFTNDLNTVKSNYESERDPQQGNYNQAYAALHGGDPNLPWQDGYLGEIGRQAGTERTNLQNTYDNAQKTASGLQLTLDQLYPNGAPVNPTGMSDVDVLKAAGALKTQSPLHLNDPYASLLEGLNFNNTKLTNSQQALQQLLQKYNANNYVGINDAAQFQPTQVAPGSTPGQLPSGGDVMTNNPQASDNTLAALKNIYNR